MKVRYAAPALPILFATVLYGSALAQWEPTNGPSGGNVLSMAHTEAEVYAGFLSSGVYRSTDQGDSWTPMGNGLPPGSGVAAIVPSAAGLFIGTYSGVYRWNEAAGSWDGLADFSALAMVVKGSILFVANGYGQMVRSTDGGASWQAINNGLGDDTCSDCPEPMFFSTACLLVKDTCVFLGTGEGIFRTSDDGDNWTQINTGLDPSDWPVSAMVAHGDDIFAGVNGRVYRSTDNGDSWFQPSPGFMMGNILSMAVSGQDLFVGYWGNGVYHSTDQGASWAPFNQGLLNKVVNALTLSSTTLFAGILNGGINRTGPDTPEWIMANHGLPRTGVRTILSTGTELLAGSWGVGIYTLEANGLDWTASNAGLQAGGTQCLAQMGGEAFAGMTDALYRCPDTGSDWMPANTGLEGTYVRCLTASGETWHAGTPSGIFRSTDQGHTWLQSGNGGDVLNIQALLAGDDGVLYAGTFLGLYRSVDDGGNWSPLNSGLANQNIYALAFHQGQLLAGTGNGLYRFSEASQSWAPINDGFTDQFGYAFASYDPALFVGSDHGVFISNDGGSSWVAVNQGLDNTAIASFAVHNGYLYASTWGNGVWRRLLSEMTTSIDEVQAGIMGPMLLHGWPNPCTTASTIRYSLPKANELTLKVYDAVGREVATLVDGPVAAGEHEVRWDPSAQPAGVYFCRMQVNGLSQAIRIVRVE